jgi:hypothetical protein
VNGSSSEKPRTPRWATRSPVKWGSLQVAVLSLLVEVVKTLPLPRGVRRRLLERLAENAFGDHPEFSELLRRQT